MASRRSQKKTAKKTYQPTRKSPSKSLKTKSQKTAQKRSNASQNRSSNASQTRSGSTIRVKTIRPKGQWETYHLLQKQVNQAWNQFQSSVQKKAKPETVARAKNHLMLLLGECNFMAQQCMQLAARNKRKHS